MFAAGEAEDSDEDEELLDKYFSDADGDVLEQGDGGAAAGGKGKGKSHRRRSRRRARPRGREIGCGRRLVKKWNRQGQVCEHHSRECSGATRRGFL